MADATSAENLIVLLLQSGQDRVVCPTHSIAVVADKAYWVVPRNFVFAGIIGR